MKPGTLAMVAALGLGLGACAAQPRAPLPCGYCPAPPPPPPLLGDGGFVSGLLNSWGRARLEERAESECLDMLNRCRSTFAAAQRLQVIPFGTGELVVPVDH